MKKISRFTIISIFILIVVSCSEDWLYPKPFSIFTPESIFIDKAGMDAQLLVLRKSLRLEFYGQANALPNELITSDAAVYGIKANAALHNFYTQLTPTGSGMNDFNRYWRWGYNQIRNANVIISRIDVPEWSTEKDKNEILAEAYFHRAYWYYRLVHQYGDVPFLSREYTEPKFDFFTHSRKTILNKIQDDMEFAVQWLPEVVDPGKVNRAAGNHLLAKIYLANSNFDGAIAATSAVINDGIHSLMTKRFGIVANDEKYNLIWDLHQKENKSLSANTEGILVVQDKYGFPGAEVPGGTQSIRNYTPYWSHGGYLKDKDGRGAMTDKPGNWQIIKLGRGVGNCRPTNYQNYEIWLNCETDLRHDTAVNWMPMEKVLINNPNSKYYGQPITKEYSNPIDTFQAWFPWPQYKIIAGDEEQPTQPMGGHSDWYVFRLAETYLLRAEAYIWKGDLANAAADINMVRERAKAPSVKPSDVSIEYILDERARELYTEEPRKTELTRIAFIMADNNLNGYNINNFSEKNFAYDRIAAKNNFYNVGYFWGTSEYKIGPFHILWPIPQDVIDDNVGGMINQNMGYMGAEKNIPPKTEITDEQ
jgi:starch-binding outer membrane protein, SusD/RagB family